MTYCIAWRCVGFIRGGTFFSGQYFFGILALFLALTSYVYSGEILTPAAAKYSFIACRPCICSACFGVIGLGAWDYLHQTKIVAILI